MTQPLASCASNSHSGISCRRLVLVGGFRYEVDGRPVSLGTDGSRVLAYLGLHGRSRRAVVAGGLWPDSSESRASGSLRTSLWRLRRAGVVLVDRPARHLSLPDDLDVDIAGFESWAGRPHREGGPEHDPLDLTRVPRGDLLPGWSETWVLAERERLHQLRLSMLDVLAGELGRRGRWGEAVAAARSAVELDPLRESSTRALIELYLQQNDVGRAVRRFQTYRRRLACDLGIEPSADLSALVGPEHAVRPRGVPHRSLPRGPGLGARRPVGRTSAPSRAGVLPP